MIDITLEVVDSAYGDTFECVEHIEPLLKPGEIVNFSTPDKDFMTVFSVIGDSSCNYCAFFETIGTVRRLRIASDIDCRLCEHSDTQYACFIPLDTIMEDL